MKVKTLVNNWGKLGKGWGILQFEKLNPCIEKNYTPLTNWGKGLRGERDL